MNAGIELHVQTVATDVAGASAPWVLCIHSSGLMGKQWLQLVRRLRDRFRVALPDLIGYGQSPPWPAPAETFSVGHELDALRRVVANLDGPVHLVGHSYGGFLALELGRRAFVGDLDLEVASVAAFEPTVWGVLYDESEDPELRRSRDDFEAVLDGPIFARGQARDGHVGDDAWMRGFVDFWNGAGAWDALTPTRRRLMLATGRKTAREVLELCYDRTTCAQWAAITAPTLLLAGRDSNPLERAAVARLVDALPNATHTVVAGGHMAPIQNASDVNDAFVAHIDRHSR